MNLSTLNYYLLSVVYNQENGGRCMLSQDMVGHFRKGVHDAINLATIVVLIGCHQLDKHKYKNNIKLYFINIIVCSKYD